MQLSFDQILAYMGSFFWPFVRISAMLMAAPVFGARNMVFTLHRLGLAVFLTLLVFPSLPPLPAIEPLSVPGLLVLFNEIALGVAMGLILQLVFGALEITGNNIAMSMGLGYASFIDPANGVSVPVISMFYLILGTLLFLALNGHLVSIQLLLESFISFPIAQYTLKPTSVMHVILWGTSMYVGALVIALPCMLMITLINISFGMVTRAAPQMNIFAVGFPATLLAGMIVIMVTLPGLLPRFSEQILNGFRVIQQFLT